MTASATFRLGTSASPTGPWTWGAYDAAVVANAGDYYKIQLQSTSGVDAIAVTIPTADPASLAAGVPAVTVDQSAKTATLRTLSAVGQSLCVQVTVLSGGAVSGTSGLQVNVLSAAGLPVFAVGETTQYHRTNGCTDKLNAALTVAGTSAAQLRFADLRVLTPTAALTNVKLAGHSSLGDGGSGTFYWDAASTETDNGGTHICGSVRILAHSGLG